MSMKETGGPGVSAAINGDGDGITLRDYFAAKAMQALISNNKLLKEAVTYYKDSLSSEEAVAQLAYDQADFMLKERSK